MALTKQTELGEISISNMVFAQIIFEGMRIPECRGKIWPATPRGRQIGIVPKYIDTEFSMYIDVDFNEEGRVELEFSVITLFGISIKRTTKHLADYIAGAFVKYSGRTPAAITINIAGVRSRHKARRNTKVVYRYEDNG